MLSLWNQGGTGRRLIKIFRGLAQSEVTVIDPSAPHEQNHLAGHGNGSGNQLCEAVAARVTVLIYPVDEVSDMDDIAQTVEVLRRFRGLGDRSQSGQDSHHEVLPGLRTQGASFLALKPHGWRSRRSFPTPAIIYVPGRSSLDGDSRPPRR